MNRVRVGGQQRLSKKVTFTPKLEEKGRVRAEEEHSGPWV